VPATDASAAAAAVAGTELQAWTVQLRLTGLFEQFRVCHAAAW